jgi:hypothetical protein
MAEPPPRPAAPIRAEPPAAEAARLARQAREAAALRENLRKRRLQGQQRSTTQAEPPAPTEADRAE